MFNNIGAIEVFSLLLLLTMSLRRCCVLVASRLKTSLFFRMGGGWGLGVSGSFVGV